MLLHVVDNFRQASPYTIVEPAHMELAEPTINQAFERCVAQGAEVVIIHPYFLLPGRHWQQDIPRLANEAAKRHSGIRYLVTAPLGAHLLMSQIIQARIEQCTERANQQGEPCDVCQGLAPCEFQQPE
ncbi:MAG TPA: sirohydrochlorin cobaltochelatase [Planctomycetaceae bacterium]|nr:sirohydrochlorin cobaltochelatase [Blastopirellula sp.]HAY80440.1 sirohydrochlorin cobaltochelatase [Planctomycetaceae bacterium]